MHQTNKSLFLILLALQFAMADGIVQWTSTTNDSRWIEKGKFNLESWSTQPLYMEVYPDSQRQEIEGFGGCFNELEWTALNTLRAASRDSVIRSLYDSIVGCKYNMGRMPIGANDYSLDYYSHDDSAGDYDMSAFSIARDRKAVIPFIKEAMKLRPDLKMWGSPWTPPAWMKTNNNYSGAPLTWTPQNLQAYALYLGKCAKAYQTEGLNFIALFVQNEPLSNAIYPACTWNGVQLHDFVELYLGPQLKKDNVPVQLWLSTMNTSDFDAMVAPSLSDSVCRGFLSGVGYQWEGYDIMATHYQRYPSLPFWQTETRCGNGSNDWAYAEEQFGDRKNAFDRGAKAFFEWNMALEKNGLSHWNWKQSSLISIDTVQKTVTYNPQYYVSKHFSYFVNPGAHYVKMTGGFVDRVGFLNPNGDLVIIVCNKLASNVVTTIKVDNQMYKPTLPSKSFNTFVITGVRPVNTKIIPRKEKNSDGAFIAASSKQKSTSQIKIYDMQGRLLYTWNVKQKRFDSKDLHQDLKRNCVAPSVFICVKNDGTSQIINFTGKLSGAAELAK
jgi:glucosylceramidase